MLEEIVLDVAFDAVVEAVVLFAAAVDAALLVAAVFAAGIVHMTMNMKMITIMMPIILDVALVTGLTTQMVPTTDQGIVGTILHMEDRVQVEGDVLEVDILLILLLLSLVPILHRVVQAEVVMAPSPLMTMVHSNKAPLEVASMDIAAILSQVGSTIKALSMGRDTNCFSRM